MSTKNTKAERLKTKPIWIGSFQIRKILGKNVYLVQDLLKIEKVGHSSRLSFYDGDLYKPKQEIFDFYKLNKNELEINEIKDVYKERGHWKVHVSWRGFDEDEDTIEPLRNVWEDVPTLLWEAIEKLSRRKQSQLAFNVENWQQENKEINKIKQPFKVQNLHMLKKFRFSGSWPTEKRIFFTCCLKFGFNCQEIIKLRDYLPGKTGFEILSQLRK